MTQRFASASSLADVCLESRVVGALRGAAARRGAEVDRWRAARPVLAALRGGACYDGRAPSPAGVATLHAGAGASPRAGRAHARAGATGADVGARRGGTPRSLIAARLHATAGALGSARNACPDAGPADACRGRAGDSVDPVAGGIASLRGLPRALLRAGRADSGSTAGRCSAAGTCCPSSAASGSARPSSAPGTTARCSAPGTRSACLGPSGAQAARADGAPGRVRSSGSAATHRSAGCVIASGPGSPRCEPAPSPYRARPACSALGRAARGVGSLLARLSRAERVPGASDSEQKSQDRRLEVHENPASVRRLSAALAPPYQNHEVSPRGFVREVRGTRVRCARPCFGSPRIHWREHSPSEARRRAFAGGAGGSGEPERPLSSGSRSGARRPVDPRPRGDRECLGDHRRRAIPANETSASAGGPAENAQVATPIRIGGQPSESAGNCSMAGKASNRSIRSS